VCVRVSLHLCVHTLKVKRLQLSVLNSVSIAVTWEMLTGSQKVKGQGHIVIICAASMLIDCLGYLVYLNFVFALSKVVHY